MKREHHLTWKVTFSKINYRFLPASLSDLMALSERDELIRSLGPNSITGVSAGYVTLDRAQRTITARPGWSDVPPPPRGDVSNHNNHLRGTGLLSNV